MKRHTLSKALENRKANNAVPHLVPGSAWGPEDGRTAVRQASADQSKPWLVSNILSQPGCCLSTDLVSGSVPIQTFLYHAYSSQHHFPPQREAPALTPFPWVLSRWQGYDHLLKNSWPHSILPLSLFQTTDNPCVSQSSTTSCYQWVKTLPETKQLSTISYKSKKGHEK